MVAEVVQINLQRHFGGGEVFTAFLCRSFHQQGIPTRLFVHPEASFWSGLGLPATTQCVPAKSLDECRHLLANEAQSWVIAHGRIPGEIAEAIGEHHIMTGIAHMPPQGRPADRYDGYHRVFGVSGYVLSGLRAMGVPVWDEPLYGVAHMDRGAASTRIRRNSRYDWDRRKGRDRLLGWLEPIMLPLLSRPEFTAREGITLAIVSRLTPIKQFPLLFRHLVPLLMLHPVFNLEIFGSGGYASVRDLEKELKPLGSRVRWWGHQRDIGAVYGHIDYLLTGLPEKEALGLNVIEAQSAGVPVLAVDAPPFDETVIPELTGLRYCDPRIDGGADFGRVLTRLQASPFHIDSNSAAVHLEKFSPAAFDARLGRLVDFMRNNHAV